MAFLVTTLKYKNIKNNNININIKIVSELPDFVCRHTLAQNVVQ